MPSLLHPETYLEISGCTVTVTMHGDVRLSATYSDNALHTKIVINALTDADSIVRSTTVAVSKTAAVIVASYTTRNFLPTMMIANSKMETCSYFVIGWHSRFQSI